MLVKGVEMMCIGVKEPRSYKFDDGREGVSYKVELTDGHGGIEVPVAEEIYQYFEPFRKYLLDFEITQVSRNTQYGVRKDFKVRAVDMDEAEA